MAKPFKHRTDDLRDAANVEDPDTDEMDRLVEIIRTLETIAEKTTHALDAELESLAGSDPTISDDDLRAVYSVVAAHAQTLAETATRPVPELPPEQ